MPPGCGRPSVGYHGWALPLASRLRRWLQGHGVVALATLPYLGHVLVVGCLFADTLFGGRVFYLRDVSLYYFPNYVFLARSLASGVWPLWNPGCDAGAPFLMTEPLELLLVWLLGPQAALRLDGPLHVLLAMAGTTALARRMGQSRWAAWASGASFGLSGFVLSTLNLFELCHGVCWAPWVLLAYLAVLERGGARRVAFLALAVATQISTLAAEAVLQTALFALVITPRLPTRRDLRRLAAAATLAAAMAAPAILGVLTMVAGTRRAGALSPEESLAWSAHPLTLLGVLLPRFFGDVHSFSDLGFWGQPFFPDGYPYLLSLYLGVGALLLVVQAGWSRLLGVGALGVLLALGRFGPLEPLLAVLGHVLRTPVKHLLLTDLALCLLIGAGLDRAAVVPRRRRHVFWLLPGAAVTAMGAALLLWPATVSGAVGAWMPAALFARARVVMVSQWPEAFLVSGSLALGIGLVLSRARRLAPLCGLLVVIDLAASNVALFRTAPQSFYQLRPDVRELVASAAAHGRYRFFSPGAVNTPSLRWSRDVVLRSSDVPLFGVERQGLYARTNLLDGVEAALDEDRVGWAPEGATLAPPERRPSRLVRHAFEMRLANVRWILSFAELPEGLGRELGRAKLAELRDPLRLYELAGALPRAFWVPGAEVVASQAEVERRVAAGDFDPLRVVLLTEPPPERPGTTTEPSPPPLVFERPDPQTVRVHGVTPPGFVVVLEGYHAAWRVTAPSGALPLLRADGRYWAVPTPGGPIEITARYRPAWRPWALLIAGLGLVACVVLCVRGLAGPGR